MTDASEPRRPRLVVELNTRSTADLDHLVELEEMNRTTVVNRAIQVYAMLRRAQESGGEVLLSEDASTPPRMVRFV